MRVLFVSHAEKTHYYSMVPLAWAFRTAGHEVRVASQPGMADAIAESGLPAVPLGADHRWKQVMAETNDDTWAGRVCHAVRNSPDLGWPELFEFFDQSTSRYFRTINNDELVDDLVAFARQWRPDLVIWEQFSWAGAVAAEASGAAHARLLVSADMITRCRGDLLRLLPDQPADQRRDPIAEWLAETMDRYGCEFTEDAVTGQWTIGVPRHLLDLGVHNVPMRYVPYNGPAVLPDWLRQPPSRPRICVTAGLSVRGYFGIDIIPLAVLHSFADLDVDVVATLVPMPGQPTDDLPDNVTLVDFVPMHLLLPSCSAVMHIGGAGVEATAEHYGVPQLILPGFWDTAFRADRLAEAGAALAIQSHEAAPERIRGDMVRLLTEPGFAAAAELLRVQALAAPAPNDVVGELARLAARQRSRQPALV